MGQNSIHPQFVRADALEQFHQRFRTLKVYGKGIVSSSLCNPRTDRATMVVSSRMKSSA